MLSAWIPSHIHNMPRVLSLPEAPDVEVQSYYYGPSHIQCIQDFSPVLTLQSWKTYMIWPKMWPVFSFTFSIHHDLFFSFFFNFEQGMYLAETSLQHELFEKKCKGT